VDTIALLRVCEDDRSSFLLMSVFMGHSVLRIDYVLWDFTYFKCHCLYEDKFFISVINFICIILYNVITTQPVLHINLYSLHTVFVIHHYGHLFYLFIWSSSGHIYKMPHTYSCKLMCIFLQIFYNVKILTYKFEVNVVS
jgi:hypothetical protein